MIERHPHPTIREVMFHGNPKKLVDTDRREIAHARGLAENNQEILGEIGLTAADLEPLAAAGVI